MTTISQTPNRRNGLIGTILRLVAACALLIIGAYLVMLGAGKLFNDSKPTAQETHTIECRRIQLRSDESVHLVDAIGVVSAPDQSLLWDEMSTTDREAAYQWCRNNNQPLFNELYTGQQP